MREKIRQMEITCLCKIDKGKKRIAESVKVFVQDTSGIGVVELILILVVLIALVVIFKSQLTALVNSIFEKITSESSGI